MKPLQHHPSRSIPWWRRRRCSISMIACLLIILYSGFLLLTRKYINSYYNKTTGGEQPNAILSAAPIDNAPLFPRILLFITTHITEWHMKALQQCWPYIIQNSKLVAMADIFIFSTNTNQTESKVMLSTIDKLFVPANDMYSRTYNKQQTPRNVTFLAHENPGYQEGSNLALKEAAVHPNWFTGYDWIVRINPDVLIYNDTWILDIMTHDINALSILVDCTGGIIQTDFMAFRPESFPRTHYANMPNLGANAEQTATSFFAEHVTNGGVRWLQGHIQTGICRVGYQNDRSPVIHDHEFLDHCPQPEK